jgi:hypothetical protein
MVKSLRLVVLLLISVAAPLRAAEFIAEVDRTELYINEHVVLTLSLSGSDTRLRAEGVSPNIDLTVLTPDFEFGTPRAEFRFSTARARGRATSSVVVELFPRRTGRLHIPSFSVDGSTTEPITLKVLPLPANARPEAFVRSGMTHERLHVGEQTLIWLDLYYRVELAAARFSGPLESQPREIEVFPLPAEERSENVDGIEYRVSRSAWAISPGRAGEMLLVLPEVRVQTRQGKNWRLPFSEHRIDVVPLPPVAESSLVGRPEILATVPEKLRMGEPAPWEIELRSRSSLNRLPQAAPLAAMPSGLRAYMDPPEKRVELDTAGNPVSIAIYRGHLLAEYAGVNSSPALALSYFDPKTGSMETLEVAGKPLRVEASSVTQNGTPVTVQASAVNSQDKEDEAAIWRNAAFVLGLAWIMTLSVWMWTWRGRQARARHSIARSNDPLQRLLAALGNARTLEEGLERQEQRYGVDAALREAVRKVQRIRYRPNDAPQNERDAELREAIEAALAMLSRRPEAPQEAREAEDAWSPRAFSTPEKASGNTRS